jgi:hypothetical protein
MKIEIIKDKLQYIRECYPYTKQKYGYPYQFFTSRVDFIKEHIQWESVDPKDLYKVMVDAAKDIEPHWEEFASYCCHLNSDEYMSYFGLIRLLLWSQK